MCGICGFNFEDKPLLKKMCDLLFHRGPDDSGYFVDSQVSIGMRRLSVIDLKTGHQPQHNEEGNIWVVFNGEIFNFKSLRKDLEKKGHIFYTESDTEVVIHSYEEWGVSCIDVFRGQFAFCIYDSRKNILILGRDHLGLIPLYYFFDGKRFIFSSEIKSILCHDIKRIVDYRAFNLFFSLKYIPLDITLFKNVYKVPASSYLIFDLKNKNFVIKKYWNLIFDINENKNEYTLAKELKNLLEESVKIRLISDVPIGAFLSGGIDSSAIVAIMSKLMEQPVKTFSIGFEEGAPINETKYSRYVAEYYGTDHTEIIVKSPSYEILLKLVWHLDDLVADAASIPVFLMAKYAKEKITVALTGDGADEVFAGYSALYRRQKFNFAENIPNNVINSIMKFYNLIPIHKLRMGLSYLEQSNTLEKRYLRKIIHVPDREKVKIFPFNVENIENLIKSFYVNNLDLINQFTNWDLRYQLPNQFNMKIDKVTMAASLETRVPFLDKNLVSWSLTIPSRLKLKGNIEKYILRLALKDILPPNIVKRKKMGFSTPINLWLKTGLKEVSGDVLDRLGKRKNFINSNYIKTIKRNRFQEIFENRAWNLIMFEIWYETFIENDGLKPISL